MRNRVLIALLLYKSISMLQVEKNKSIISHIGKLTKTIPELSETKQLIATYLLKTQILYQEHCSSIREEIEEFEEILGSRSYFSLGKCKVMRDWVRIFRKLYVFMEGVAKLNIDDMKRIQLNSRRQQIKVQSISDLFIKQLQKYCEDQVECNKKYQQYQVQCNQLDDHLQKFKSYLNPIIFYNLQSTSQSSKKLEKNFHKCENLQASLLSNLQLLDDKRKFLCSSIYEIKEEYFYLIHHHLEGFKNIALSLVDKTKDEMCMKVKSSSKIETGDIFGQQIERFENKYGQAEAEEQLLEGLQDTFKNENENVYIGSDYKLFMDRCETFRDKKCSSIEQSLYLQKKLFKQIQKQNTHFINISQESIKIEKEVFKSNGKKNSNKRVGKYFGANILAIVELCEMIIENPRKRFEKLSKAIQANEEQIRKIIQSKQEEGKKFKKRIQIVLDEHEDTKKAFKRQSKMSNEKVSNFKLNVQKSFMHFKSIVQDFSKREKQIDESFDMEVKRILDLANMQVNHSLLSFLLSKEKQQFNMSILSKLNTDGQIINIVKEDSRYDVLFNEALSPSLFKNFNSLIKKKNYDEVKKVMIKKESHQRVLGKQTNSFCCGVSSSRRILASSQTQHEYTGGLVCENEVIKFGHIKFINRGILFEQSSFNPFTDKVSLMIPIKQMVTFAKKSLDTGNCVEITTNMGSISFCLEQTNQFFDNLEKKITPRMSSQENDRKQRHSESFSFLKNSSLTEFRVTYDSVVRESKDRTSSVNKNCDLLIFKELGQKLKEEKMFSQVFKLVGSGKKEEKGRKNYEYEDEINKFLIKQRLNVRISGAMNYIFLDYIWKISFPEAPLLKSFNHSQSMRLEIQANEVKMIVNQKIREEETLFVRKKFFNQVDKMNENISKFISDFCERDTEVIIEDEKNGEDDSLMLELESLGKDELSSRNQPRLSRMVSTLTNIDKP